MNRRPNVVFIFSDQHRAQATGYSGNEDIKTPHMDKLSRESISFATALSGHPLCSPYRASLMTGQYPVSHGVFVNDVCLYENIKGKTITLAQAFSNTGYNTAYVGKWHLDGHGRDDFCPKERRLGFDYWRVQECTHHYNDSYYYQDDGTKQRWEGYDAEAQMRCVQHYIKTRDRDKPFMLMLSWGPPHNPYDTAPQKFKDRYNSKNITLRSNVPKDLEEKIREDLKGYYAHISALDTLLGDLIRTIDEEGLREDTILVYTSDHGDMLGSHGYIRKQKPWDESILVPFLLRYPQLFGNIARVVNKPINAPDIMPTLLGLCEIPIPETVEGINYAAYLKGQEELDVSAALIECIYPLATKEYGRSIRKEYRGIRTERYTYVRDLAGPWLFYDNKDDPYQMRNLCNFEKHMTLQHELDSMLQEMLKQRNDPFLKGEVYIKKWGYQTDEWGCIPYEN